jgi:hypothetical protein
LIAGICIKRFLVANWNRLAAFAWEHYQKQGRGAVVVEEGDFVHSEVPQFTTLQLRYVAENTVLLKDQQAGDCRLEAGGGAMGKAEMILRETGGCSGYLIGTAPPPPEAFAQQQAEGN